MCVLSCDSILVKTGKLIGSVLCLFGGSRLVGWVYIRYTIYVYASKWCVLFNMNR